MKKDIRYVPSCEDVIEGMLDLACVGPSDVVYDLGSGDGRVVIAAARRGARAVGIELDRALVELSRADAEEAGVRAEFRLGSFFEEEIRDATVVTLYVHQSVNLKLLPRLRRELRRGTRVVSQLFDMGVWQPASMSVVGGKPLFLWII